MEDNYSDYIQDVSHAVGIDLQIQIGQNYITDKQK